MKYLIFAGSETMKRGGAKDCMAGAKEKPKAIKIAENLLSQKSVTWVHVFDIEEFDVVYELTTHL
jgi:hypothetical protein